MREANLGPIRILQFTRFDIVLRLVKWEGVEKVNLFGSGVWDCQVNIYLCNKSAKCRIVSRER